MNSTLTDMESGSSSYSDAGEKKRRKKKTHRSVACTVLAGSVVETVLAFIYCFVMFVIFWQVLDDPVNFPDLFPLRIDTPVLMLFQFALVYGVGSLVYSKLHYNTFCRAILALGSRGADIPLDELLKGHASQIFGAKSDDHLADLRLSSFVLQQCRQDYLLSIAAWSVAILLPWNLWGYTRVTLFGGLALYVPIVWFLFALAAYIRLHGLPDKHNSPVWESLREKMHSLHR
jgi:hypothetical protein